MLHQKNHPTMKNLSFWTLLSLFLLLVNPTGAVVAPDDDPFYKPPDGYENEEPGSVLRFRVTPNPLRSIFLPVNIKASWQVLVRSTDSLGNPTAIVTTIIEPYNADNSKLVSYQAAEDSAASRCAPSYSLQFGAPVFSTLILQAEMYLIQAALDKGYWVVTPDYEGPISAFTAGRLAGHATVDSIRATFTTANQTGLSPDAKTILWVYSGGTIASGWAAALQPSYAPELSKTLIGAAVGGFVTNITSSAVLVEGGLFQGLVYAAINGLINQYSQLRTYIEDVIYPNKLQYFFNAAKLCVDEVTIAYVFHNIFFGPFRIFRDGWSVLQDPIAQLILNNNTLAYENNGEIPQIPLFIFHGKLDEIVSFPEALRTYNNWCSWGAPSIEFAADDTTGHITEVLFGEPAAFGWIVNRFNGAEPVKGCTLTYRLNNWLYPTTDSGLKDILLAFFQSVFGYPLGPGNNGEDITIASLDSFMAKYGATNSTQS